MEKRTLRYVVTLVLSLFGTGVAYVMLSKIAFEMTWDQFYIQECVQGISGEKRRIDSWLSRTDEHR